MLEMRRARETDDKIRTHDSMETACDETATTDRPMRMDDDNGCSRHTACTLTFHHRNATAASPRLAFHSATCDAGRGGLAVPQVLLVVVCDWQASSSKHIPPRIAALLEETPPRPPSVTIAASINNLDRGRKKHEKSRSSVPQTRGLGHRSDQRKSHKNKHDAPLGRR